MDKYIYIGAKKVRRKDLFTEKIGYVQVLNK